MNFIELQLKDGSSVLVNLSNVTCIFPNRDGTLMVCFDADETIVVTNSYDEIHSTITTMQRRNGR